MKSGKFSGAAHVQVAEKNAVQEEAVKHVYYDLYAVKSYVFTDQSLMSMVCGLSSKSSAVNFAIISIEGKGT